MSTTTSLNPRTGKNNKQQQSDLEVGSWAGVQTHARAEAVSSAPVGGKDHHEKDMTIKCTEPLLEPTQGHTPLQSTAWQGKTRRQKPRTLGLHT